jgi:hypothetical protein
MKCKNWLVIDKLIADPMSSAPDAKGCDKCQPEGKHHAPRDGRIDDARRNDALPPLSEGHGLATPCEESTQDPGTQDRRACGASKR